MNTKLFLLFIVLTLAALACTLPITTAAPATSTPECESCDLPLPTEIAPTETSSPIPPPVEPTPGLSGSTFTCDNVSGVIPEGVANSIRCNTVPPTNSQNDAPWDVAPAYTEIGISGYRIADHFHKPVIRVYPADEYASMNEAVGGVIQNLKDLIAAPDRNPENLPFLPLYNAGQVFHAQITHVPFQNGTGIRYLTEFAQYFAPINNYDVIYTYQGLTSDGKYYVSIVLPIHSARYLAMTNDPGSPVPSDGIPFPGYTDPNADFVAYYTAVADKLNASLNEDFTPSLSMLDQLAQSISVKP